MRKLLNELETPCLVIDLDIVKRNIAKMQSIASQYNVSLRPHIKTHKMVYFAHLQMKAGACGITCAKVSEAEVMADGGLDDIFIAYPLVGSFRLERAMKLARRCRRLILAIDSKETADMLSTAATKALLTIEVRLEIDTGARRTGITTERLVELALYVQSLPGLKLTGIYTFKSLIYQGAPTEDREKAGQEEGRLMADAAGMLREAGLTINEISAGSTPTGENVARTGLVSEIRPGTYIFNDHMMVCKKWCSEADIAAYLYATVVSTTYPDYAVIDGGVKTFPMDITPDEPPCFYPGYAFVEQYPELKLTRMSEEHGMLHSKSGNTGLHTGQLLQLRPIHICPAVNMQNHVYIYDREKETLQKMTVDARGMLV